jgi:hypothetical protein
LSAKRLVHTLWKSVYADVTGCLHGMLQRLLA